MLEKVASIDDGALLSGMAFRAAATPAARHLRRLTIQDRPDHTDVPDTYDEWLNVANEQVTHMMKQGFIVTKVTVDPDEFTQYCHRRIPTATPSLLMT